MTLNGHFTLNVRCYEQRFQNLFYIDLASVEPILVVSCHQQRCAEADRDPQNIWDLRKDADLS